jgi:hypothetical protein
MVQVKERVMRIPTDGGLLVALALLVAVVPAAAPAAAQATRPAEPPASQPAASAPAAAPAGLLAGPRVEPAALQDTGRIGRASDARRNKVPPQRWFQIVRDMTLDPEQRRKIEAVAHRELQDTASKLQQRQPKAEAYQQRVWDLLAPGQQAELREELAVIRKRNAERRRQQQQRRENRQRDRAGDDA